MEIISIEGPPIASIDEILQLSKCFNAVLVDNGQLISDLAYFCLHLVVVGLIFALGVPAEGIDEGLDHRMYARIIVHVRELGLDAYDFFLDRFSQADQRDLDLLVIDCFELRETLS